MTAGDGFYMLAERTAIFFPGIRGTFYRLSILTGNGLIVIIGGYLEREYGNKQKAWSTMVIVDLIMAALTIYNYFSTPGTEDAKTKEEIVGTQSKFWSRLASFSKKKLGSMPLFYYSAWRIPVTKMLTFPY
jgi:PAT family beta-lactamase induction signal transducer AmpG